MISDAIIVALIGLAGQWLISSKKSRDDEIKDAQREQRQNDRMEVIEKKLDEHNGYAKKFEEVSVAMTEFRKDIEYLHESLGDKKAKK